MLASKYSRPTYDANPSMTVGDSQLENVCPLLDSFVLLYSVRDPETDKCSSYSM